MKINRLDNFGRGITYKDGKIMFVNNALPDEDVEVDIIKEEKRFYLANASIINNKNDNRVIPKCPFYSQCGGCNLMHINNDYQDKYKLNKVKDILKRYADLDVDIKYVMSNKELFYRNKITYKDENGVIGYYNDDTHDIVSVNNCLLANNKINEFMGLNLIKFNDGEIIIRSNYLNEILISIFSSDKVSIDYDNLPDYVRGIVVNKKCVYKDDYFYDMIGDYKFKISYDSFFQINNYVASCIFDILSLNLKGNNLLDLYCGVGTLGICVSKNFKNIYGIEKIKNAILNAKENAVNAGITNAHYYAGNTNDVLKKIKVKFDTIIVDPPRQGLNANTIKEILSINPRSLAYVSCDPMTLARDLKILGDTYKVNKVYALNMFPNTYHVETVCVLERK